jgi:hypothetical protein
MKKISLFLLFICQISYSQTIEFLTKNDTLQKPKYQEFIYINDATDTVGSIKVARIKASGGFENPTQLFLKIKSESQKLGANSFRFNEFKKNEDNSAELILDVYFSTDEILGTNFKNIPKNKIYIFGDDNLLSTKSQNYKVNGIKYEIGSGQFKEFSVKVGEELKINKGGFTGMTIWIKGIEDKSSTFINFSGGNVTGASYNPYNRGVGISINTGFINKMEPNIALFLLEIFKEQ